jgi:hypothetical protein
MRYTKQYVEQRNFYNKLFKKPLLDADKLTTQQVKELLDSLEGDLSPENLTCDGELRGAALKKRATMLNGAKRELEARVA